MMDFKAKIKELRDSKGPLLQQVEDLAAKGAPAAELDAVTDKLTAVNDQIAALERAAEASNRRAEPVEPPQGGPEGAPQAKKPKVTPFASLGEQLMAVRNAAKGIQDKRLLEVNNAVIGAGEANGGADGGFAIQEDFAGMILETAVQTGDILSRVDRYTASSASNSMRWLMVDETDVSKSVFGGVQMYWASEGATVGHSKPAFREMKLDLEKMMGFAYATDELLTDASFMTGFFGTAFSVALNRLLEDTIITGDGVGKPLGLLNSKALVTVPKEDGQAPGSVTLENVFGMWRRALLKNRKDAVWLLHPDLETELPKLKLGDNLLWMPEGGLTGSMYQTLLGRPILYNDNCSAQGSVGDMMLVDLKEYMLLSKGTAKQDWSMHVEFLTDQMCFRIVFRCNGTPKLTAPVKLKNSKNTRSPYVTLAARA